MLIGLMQSFTHAGFAGNTERGREMSFDLKFLRNSPIKVRICINFRGPVTTPRISASRFIGSVPLSELDK